MKLLSCIYSDLQGASLVTQLVKNLSVVPETQVWSLGWNDPLEKEMATHSSILAWKISWTEEPGGLLSMGLQRVRHHWATSTYTFNILNLLKNNCYLFFAMLSLRCCLGSLVVVSRGCSLVALQGLLVAAASCSRAQALVHRLQKMGCRTQAPQLWLPGSRAQAQQLWHTGPVALQLYFTWDYKFTYILWVLKYFLT